MNKQVEIIKNKVSSLEKDGNKLIRDYEKFGWKDTRPKEYKEVVIDHQEEIFNMIDNKSIKPKQKQIPSKFQMNFQKWYSSCCALIENNFSKERISEFKSIYEHQIKSILSSNYTTKDKGFRLIDSIRNQTTIINSLPEYVAYKSIDIELEIASTLMNDELLEADYLLKKGYIRASGAIAGVVLERHLKMICEKQNPPLKYSKKATISKLNDMLKDNTVLEVPEWRNIQYLADIRNICDHDSDSQPTKEVVTDLISGVKKVIHYY